MERNDRVFSYGKFTKEELEEVIENVFKDYKDPTEGMTLGQMTEFDKAMKKEVKKYKQ